MPSMSPERNISDLLRASRNPGDDEIWWTGDACGANWRIWLVRYWWASNGMTTDGRTLWPNDTPLILYFTFLAIDSTRFINWGAASRRYRINHHSGSARISKPIPRPSYNLISRPSYNFGLCNLQRWTAAIHYSTGICEWLHSCRSFFNRLKYSTICSCCCFSPRPPQRTSELEHRLAPSSRLWALDAKDLGLLQQIKQNI